MISLVDLAKEYGNRTLFSGVNYHFPEGERIALVGANGSGKTTLLRILCGEAQTSAGEIVCPARARLGYLPQEPNPNPGPTILKECVAGAFSVAALHHKMDAALLAMEAEPEDESLVANYSESEEAFRRAGGYELESQARSLLDGLGFREVDVDPRALSGGWRMRLELARLFINKPNFLILDEPTNHLDLPSLVWFERYLTQFPGTLLFVSHDRQLLNRLATITLEIANGTVTAYSGNFDAFLEQREQRQELLVATAKNISRKKAHMQRFVDRFGAKASKATQAQSRKKMIERLIMIESEIHLPETAKTMNFKLPSPKTPGRQVLKIRQGRIGYTAVLTDDIDLLCEHGQRIAVIGANGLGKSTLLKTIAGETPALGGEFALGHNVEICWFAQNQLDTLDPEADILTNLLAANPRLGEPEARGILGRFLFSGEEVSKKIKVLSGGEKSRVGLARMLAANANFLLLDEPTNHLDMMSIEILVQGLTDYQGTILFVSHDREFINSLCTHIFVIAAGGQCALFEGDLDDYTRMAQVAGFPNVLGSEEVKCEGKNHRDATSKRGEDEIKSLQREYQKLTKKSQQGEAHIDQIQKEIAELEKSMAAANQDFEILSGLQQQRDQLITKLEEAESSWLECEDARDACQRELKARGRAP